jgi:hypothetical protein
MPGRFDRGAAGVDRRLHHVGQARRRQAQLQFATVDPRDIHQIVDQTH